MILSLNFLTKVATDPTNSDSRIGPYATHIDIAEWFSGGRWCQLQRQHVRFSPACGVERESSFPVNLERESRREM
jgi:hypothetical protein